MRQLLKWLVVTLGIAALVRWLRRRGGQAEAPPAEQAGDDPADELRRKLAEARTTEVADESSGVPETTVGERRAEVHEHGRAAIDEMRQASDEE